MLASPERLSTPLTSRRADGAAGMGPRGDPTLRRSFRPLAVLCATLIYILPAVSAAQTDHSHSPTVAKLVDLMPSWIQRRNGLWQVLYAPITSATRWDLLILVGSCAVLSLFAWRRKEPIENEGAASSRKAAHARDRGGCKLLKRTLQQLIVIIEPSLLKNNSFIQTYKTSKAVYPAIRTFFHRHLQADKLPTEPKPLPVLVFIHGLGGSLAQFHPLLNSLTNVAPCFGIDLPGCGRSEFAPRTWDAYSHAALVELLDRAIGDACERAETDEAVLICHSMGCSLAASLLANKSDASLHNTNKVSGLIAICPKASSPTPHEIKSFRRLLSIPSPLFDVFRAWDRRGGVESASVSRFVGDSASLETKRLQLWFNEQSKTDVWRRMAWGAVPSINSDGTLLGGLPGPETWAQISIPVFLIAGEADKVTRPKEVSIITEAMRSAAPMTAKAKASDTSLKDNDRGSRRIPTLELGTSLRLRAIVLPAPAAHGLLYDHSTYRTVSGLILSFLADHIQHQLSMGWQLQYLQESNKWDVKNLAKWQAVVPVSKPIGTIFRAMKTLREGDANHSPAVFVKTWGDGFKALIDISHDSPVYNPHNLEEGGVEYHKFPTVSKIPPTVEEVRGFVALVDQLRLEEQQSSADRFIGVHCHYGFNRTGFFICSYLIEREKYSVQEAADAFAEARPPGIRHEHFLDTLFVRYCVGLKRTPTV